MSGTDEETAPEIDVEYFHSMVIALTDTKTNSKLASEATSFLEEIMNNYLHYFVYICIHIAANVDEELPTRMESLILLRGALKETKLRKIDLIRQELVKNELQEISNNLYSTLLDLSFGEVMELQKPASEAFAQAFNVYYRNWEAFKSKFFTEIKPDTLESCLPTFSLFLDLMYSSYFEYVEVFADDQLLTGLFDTIMRILDPELIESVGAENMYIYIDYCLRIIIEMLKNVKLFNFLVDIKYMRFSKFLQTFPHWLGVSSIDIYRLAYDILELFAEKGHDYLTKTAEEGEEEKSYWDIIEEYLHNGYNCDSEEFLEVVLNFWENFSCFEFNHLFNNNFLHYFKEDVRWRPLNLMEPPKRPDGNSKRPPKEFYPFTKVAFSENESLHLNFFLDVLFNIPDEMVQDGNVNAFMLQYAAATALRTIIMLYPKMMNIILSIISDKLAAGSIGEMYGCLLILEATCYQFQYNAVLDFFKTNIGVITDIITPKADVEVPDILASGAMITLSAIYKIYGPKLIDESVFQVIKALIERDTQTNERLLRREFKLLSQVIRVVPSSVVAEQFENYIDILANTRSPDMSPTSLSAFEELTICFIERSFEADVRPLLETLLGKLMNEADNLYNNINDVNQTNQSLNYTIDVLWVIQTIYINAYDMMEPKQFFDVFYRFLELQDPQLYYSIYLCFCNVITKYGSAFNEAGVALLESAHDALLSSIPKLIAMSGRLIGCCMKYLTTQDIMQIGFECTSAILDQLVSDNPEIIHHSHPMLIIGFSDALVGFSTNFPADQVDAFKQIITDMVLSEFDKDDEFEREFQYKLYKSLLVSMKNIALYQLKLNPKKNDEDFIVWFKKFVFGVFINKKIVKNKMYNNKELLEEFIGFIESLISEYKTKFNVQCNGRYVMEVLYFAMYGKWHDLWKPTSECINRAFNS